MFWSARAPRSRPRSRYRDRDGGAGVETALRVVHAHLDAERKNGAIASRLHVLRRKLGLRVDLLDDALETLAGVCVGAQLEPSAQGDATKSFLRHVDPHVR